MAALAWFYSGAVLDTGDKSYRANEPRTPNAILGTVEHALYTEVMLALPRCTKGFFAKALG